MRMAQQLYEGIDIGAEGIVGLITYMRTDSVSVSSESQREAREFVVSNYGADYIPESPPKYKTRSKSAQEAHEAVRPTTVVRTPKAMKGYLSRDQHRLYKLIWDRFVASQMSPAVYDTVSADIFAGAAEVAIKKRPYMFRASGSTLKFPGFLALYEETEPADRPDDDQNENQVPPTLSKDELLDALAILPEQHFTQPPPRFSEATLVKAMEEHGIGRPSTYASIVETVQRRGYVEQENRRLHPTPTGELVNDLLVEHFPDVLSVDFTANMEDDLDKIAEGRSPWVPVIDRFYQKFDQRLKAADEVIPKHNIQAEPEFVGRDCPNCGKPLVFREGRYGRFVGCSDFPKCRHTEQILITMGVTCPTCSQGEITQRRTRKGRIFYGCSRYPDCDYTTWEKPKDGVPKEVIAQPA